jgi:hypothetical protein
MTRASGTTSLGVILALAAALVNGGGRPRRAEAQG